MASWVVIIHVMLQVRASNLLKEEGNRLFSAGKTTEATEKYERAKSNLSGTHDMLYI